MIVCCIFSLISLAVARSSLQLAPLQSDQQYQRCNIGDVLQNECNRCVCAKSYYQCTPVACDKDQQKNNLPANRAARNPTCHPDMMYIVNSTTCICDDHGHWPHKTCTETFGSLPASLKSEQHCDPDTYVIMDCNVCRCNSEGIIDTDRCTRNDCNSNSRRTNGLDNVYGSCAANMWYSFAPCQLCYCANENKLVCNTGNHLNVNPLQLGTYKLTTCGETLLNDAVGLVPKGQTVLREGDYAEKKETTDKNHKSNNLKEDESGLDVAVKPLATQSPTTPNKVKVQVKGERNDITEEQEADSDSYERPVSNVKTREISTQQPYNTDEDDVVSSESKEIPIKLTEDEPRATQSQDTVVHSQVAISTGQDSQNMQLQKANNHIEYSGNSVKGDKDRVVQFNFPLMLDRLLSLALRKSMVKLDETGTPCQQGSTKSVDCNKCFCLVNGKMLCTDKVCQ